MVKVIFTQPFLVGAKTANETEGNVVVLDLAFNAGSPQGQGTPSEQFGNTTVAFINALGDRLVGWLDHHPHSGWPLYENDPRFVLVSREIAPACPPLINPQLVQQFGEADTIIAHGDFDGIMSAIKYLNGGIEPYTGCDNDSVAADSRVGTLSQTGSRYEAALKANLADDSVRHAIVAELTWKVNDPEEARESATQRIETAMYAYNAIQRETNRLAGLFTINGKVAWQDTAEADPYDMTQLLLAGQKQAAVSVIRNVQRGKAQITVAGPREWNFVQIFGLIGGMPNRVNLSDGPVDEVIAKINQA